MERSRKSEKAEQIGNLPCSLARKDRQTEGKTGECTRTHHAGAIPLSLSAFLAVQRKWPPSIQPLGFPAKKTCTLLFAKIHAAFVPGMNYATLIAPSPEVHSDTPLPSFRRVKERRRLAGFKKAPRVASEKKKRE